MSFKNKGRPSRFCSHKSSFRSPWCWFLSLVHLIGLTSVLPIWMCYLSFFYLHKNWVGCYLGHFCKLFSCLAQVFLIIVLGFFQSFKTVLISPEWENSMWSLSTLNSLIRPRKLLFWHWCYSPDLLPLFTCGDLLCQEERFEPTFFLTSYMLFFWMQNMYLEQGNTAVLSNIVVIQYLLWASYDSLWNSIYTLFFSNQQ